jgi:hypothetical protein
MKHSTSSTRTSLPYGIEIEVANGSGHIRSDLAAELVDAGQPSEDSGQAMVHAVEALLLALAVEGVDLATPAAARAVETACHAMAEYLCCV